MYALVRIGVASVGSTDVIVIAVGERGTAIWCRRTILARPGDAVGWPAVVLRRLHRLAEFGVLAAAGY